MTRGLDRRATRRASALALAAGACVALGAAPARAIDGTGCMPPVVGVPWSGAAPDVTALDDLKWNGAFAYDWAMGGPRDGEFRNLLSTDAAGNKTIYVYYQSLVHRTVINYLDGVQFGINFTDASGNIVAYVVNATFGADNTSGPHGNGTWLAADATTTPIAPGNIHFAKQVTSGVTQSPATDQPIPGWLVPNTGSPPPPPPLFFWIIKDPVDGTLSYVVQAKIPISTTDQTGANGLYVDPAKFTTMVTQGIPFWGDELSMEVDPSGATIQVPRPWPNLVDYTNQGRTNDAYQVPAPQHWGVLQPSTVSSMPGGQCTGGGLRFGPSDITNNGGYLIDLFSVDSTNTPQRGFNRPSVTAKNAGPSVTPSDIHAVYNIAPLGSQDVHSLAWHPLDTNGNVFTCGTSKSGDFKTCNPQPVLGTPIDGVGAGASGATTFSVTASSQWNPDWSYICSVVGDDGKLYDGLPILSTVCGGAPYRPSTTDAANGDALGEHECMLVQLHSQNNSVQFDTQAQFMNMHVAAHASHFEDKARIDTSGVVKIKNAGGHWVYIYVETRNMLHDIPNGVQSPYTQRQLDSLLYGCEEGNDCIYNNGSQPTFDFVAANFPTTVMHVYHETGLYKRIGHKKVAIYVPQSSYGYYVSHDGMLYGWDAAIKGAKKVRPGVYKLWIKDDDHVDVTTSIDALDQPRCDGGGDDDDGGDDDSQKSSKKSSKK